MKWPFQKRERDKWVTKVSPSLVKSTRPLVWGELDRRLYEQSLPRGLMSPRFTPDRPRVNYWMPPSELLARAHRPGDIILGKLGGSLIGHLDDRPQVTVAGARSGKSSTVLEPNVYTYPGSMLVLDPKAEFAASAHVRRALGHRVYVLDPFAQSGQPSANFNPLDGLDPEGLTIIDDVMEVAHALIPDDGEAKSRHFTDSARALLRGVILLALTLPEEERNLVSVRDLLCLTHPRLIRAVQDSLVRHKKAGADPEFFDLHRNLMEGLLRAMADSGSRFGGILSAMGNRFLGSVAREERASIFSTAAAHTDFIDSLELRKTLTSSDFRLEELRNGPPTTIFLCLGIRHMTEHFRWLRLVIQRACNILEKLGRYPRDRHPILFMMEEFPTLGRMEIMERAAAYLPGYGVKLWVVLQNLSQLQLHYPTTWETFFGNAGVIQCFANGDDEILEYLSRRLEKLLEPFELRTTFARKNFSQLLLFEGEAPAAALRLEHHDVGQIRLWLERQSSLSLSTVWS